MKVLVIDNYDSFVYNIVQMLGELGADPLVFKNDSGLDWILSSNPEAVIIPGSGPPKNAGISVQVIREFEGKIPILGICLGHYCIAEFFGGRTVKAKRIFHGKTSMIRHAGEGIFKGIPSPFKATRYHSLVVDRNNLPSALRITAVSEEDEEIMGLQHVEKPVFGLQFHPDSILTEYGYKILENFLKTSG